MILNSKIALQVLILELADTVIAMDSFGASAPASLLFEKFGFSVASIMEKIK